MLVVVSLLAVHSPRFRRLHVESYDSFYQAICEVLAERLAERYWDTPTPDHREVLELCRKAAAIMRRVEIHPTRIRSYRD